MASAHVLIRGVIWNVMRVSCDVCDGRSFCFLSVVMVFHHWRVSSLTVEGHVLGHHIDLEFYKAITRHSCHFSALSFTDKRWIDEFWVLAGDEA